jgi:hypothetical protein
MDHCICKYARCDCKLCKVTLLFARVADGEADTIEGWLAYGAALNEGRALFPSNEQFGQWVIEVGLHQVGVKEIRLDERAAAMWAAANPDDFKAAQEAGNARTVRGIYAKWQEMDAARKLADQKARMEEERTINDMRATHGTEPGLDVVARCFVRGPT